MESLRKKNGNPLGVSLSGNAKKMPDVDTRGRFKTKNKKHNAKITKNWNIEDFEIRVLYVQVLWHALPMGQTQQLEVCRPCFEQWLGEQGRLDWCMEGLDTDHTPELISGIMAIDDYWENVEYEVKRKDLRDYIVTEQLIK
ncbi:MAG: hypothetical protein H6550_13935 [Chitinophagales bacterium]|nr:hypothetical protein [Chitinophagales bacterium]